MIDWDEPTMTTRDGVAIASYEAGDGPAVVFCHGFPELAFSWHRILPAVADAGFRAIALDQRGYGRSDCPPHVQDYAVAELAADVVGVLDGLGVDDAVLVGHDWGSPVVWATALLHPGRVRGVAAVNNPYRAAADVDPLAALRAEWGDEHYIVNFHNRGPEDPESSDARFGAAVEQVFRGLYRAALFDMAAFAALPKDQRTLRMEPIVFAADPPGRFVLTEDELARFVGAFERTGFTSGINWYRNISRNWHDLKGLDPRIDRPCLMIEVTGDPSGPPGCSADMAPWIADLETAVIEDCGHWTQHEKPEELAAIIVDWLTRRHH